MESLKDKQQLQRFDGNSLISKRRKLWADECKIRSCDDCKHIRCCQKLKCFRELTPSIYQTWSHVFLYCLCTEDELLLTAFFVAMKQLHSMVIACVHRSFRKRLIFRDRYRPAWGTEGYQCHTFRETVSRRIPSCIFWIITEAKLLTIRPAQMRFTCISRKKRKCTKFLFQIFI